jgi:hypothetical protein
MSWQHEIQSSADELTEPRSVEQRVYRHDHNRNKKLIGVHQVLVPGLLRQLYLSVQPGAANQGAMTGRPGSRPPLGLEALNEYRAITLAVAKWRAEAGLLTSPDDGVESNLRHLMTRAYDLPDERGQALLADLRRWRSRCLVMVGWEKLYRPRGAVCPILTCAAEDTLRINLTTAVALCRACGTTWDGDDLVRLAHALQDVAA